MSATVVCRICNEAILLRQYFVSANCGHVYHQNCLKDWRNHYADCKICHTFITGTKRLFLQMSEDYFIKDKINKINRALARCKRTLQAKVLEIEELKRELANKSAPKEVESEVLKAIRQELQLENLLRSFNNAFKSLQTIKNKLQNCIKGVVDESIASTSNS